MCGGNCGNRCDFRRRDGPNRFFDCNRCCGMYKSNGLYNRFYDRYYYDRYYDNDYYYNGYNGNRYYDDYWY